MSDSKKNGDRNYRNDLPKMRNNVGTRVEYNCEDCGVPLRESEYNRNDGLCDGCASALNIH